MPKFTLRRGVWGGIAILAVVVSVGSAYLLTRTHPNPPLPPERRDPMDLSGELRRAKAMPEWGELAAMVGKGSKPLAAENVARAGELLDHPNYMIRKQALLALGHASAPAKADATALVVPRLKDPNLFVRIEAMNSLAVLDAKDRIPELVAFLNSDDSDERACVRHALQRLGHPGK